MYKIWRFGPPNATFRPPDNRYRCALPLPRTPGRTTACPLPCLPYGLKRRGTTETTLSRARSVPVNGRSLRRGSGAHTEQLRHRAQRRPLGLVLTAHLSHHPHRPLTQPEQPGRRAEIGPALAIGAGVADRPAGKRASERGRLADTTGDLALPGLRGLSPGSDSSHVFSD